MIKNLLTLLSKHYLFLFILATAACLRLLNPTFAQPILYVNGDEPPNYQGALYVFANKSLFVRTAIYPPFGSYLQVPVLLWTFLCTLILGGAKTIKDIQFLVITQPGYYLFIPRIISGVLGTATVYVLYKIVLLISPKNKILALMASLFLTFSFNHGQMSHSGRPWASAMFFFSLTIWFTLKSLSLSKHEQRYSFLASLCAVVTYGIHQIGVFAFAFFVIVRIVEKAATANLKEAFLNKTTWIGIIFISIGIGGIRLLEIGNPTAQWFPYFKQFPPQYPLIAQIWELLLDSNMLYTIKQLFITEPGIFFFSLTGIALSRPWKKPFTSLFIYALFATLVIGSSFKQPRYLLPALIPLSIFAAQGFLDCYQHIQIKWMRFGFFTVSLGMISFNLVGWNLLLIRTSTMEEAMVWIEQKIPPHETILSAAGKWVPYTPSKEVLQLQQQKNPHFFEQAYKILHEYTYPPNVRSFVYLDELVDLNNREMTFQFIDTFPLSYRYLLDIYFDPANAPLRGLNTNKYTKVASFSPLKNHYQPEEIHNALATVNHPALPLLLLRLQRLGPYVDIYKKN